MPLRNNNQKEISIVNYIFIVLLTLVTGCINSESQNQPTIIISDTTAFKQKEKNVRDFSLSATNTASFTSSECIVKSTLELPYHQKLDPKKVSYQVANCKIVGDDKFLCGEKSLRYIPLPKFENITVILIPMDCGDFNYKYYLVTLFDNQVVSDYYVEGEWYEPGDEGYKEFTSFSIDESYILTVTTDAIENGKTTMKEAIKLKILDDGVIQKM